MYPVIQVPAYQHPNCLHHQPPQCLSAHLIISLQWRHNERDGVSNHQPHDCLLNRLFRRRSKKTSKLRVTGLCEGNLPVTGEFPTQRASNADFFSIWWRRHDKLPAAIHTITVLNLSNHNDNAIGDDKVGIRTITLVTNLFDFENQFIRNAFELKRQSTLAIILDRKIVTGSSHMIVCICRQPKFTIEKTVWPNVRVECYQIWKFVLICIKLTYIQLYNSFVSDMISLFVNFNIYFLPYMTSHMFLFQHSGI